MKLRCYIKSVITLSLFLIFMTPGSLFSQVWWEETGEKHDYDLSNYRILIVLGDDFDYHETMVIKKYWEDWKAQVEIAGFDVEITGHVLKRTKKGWDSSEKRKVEADLLLSQVNLLKYDVLFFPGGNSSKNLLKRDSSGVVHMVQKANKNGLVLAAICHGPQILAAASVIEGRKATGHRDVMEGIEEAGGEYVMEACVVDENIITGNWPYFETMAVKVAEKLLYPNGGGPSEKSLFETNPVLKAIKERRSIRSFQDKDVAPETIQTILKAATWAPSANNDQPWKFVLVRNKKVKRQIVEALKIRMKDYYEAHGIPIDRMVAYWYSIFAAPIHIFVFCDTSDIEIEKEWEDIQWLWSVQGVSAACQNILLAAKAMNLGSVWFGTTLAVEDEVKSLLNIPDKVHLMTVIAIGYPAYEPLPPVRRTLSDITFFERWETK